MSAATVLSEAEFESRVIAGLAHVGIVGKKARKIAAMRWPMAAVDVLAECEGRGRYLCLDDLTAYLRHRYGRDRFNDGETLVADSIGWPQWLVSELLGWAVEHGRGIPSEGAPERPDPTAGLVSVADMLEALRSENIVDRLRGGFALARSLGVGLRQAGESREDVEHVIAPAISKAIGAAICEGAGAVDALAAVITTDPAAAFGAAPRRRPSSWN